MAFRHMEKVIYGAKHLIPKRNGVLHLNAMLYHCSEESRGEPLPQEWYKREFPKLMKLTQLLKDVDLVDGRLVNITDGSIIVNGRAEHKMVAFKSLATVFVGSPLVQQTLWNNVVAWSGGRSCNPSVCFSKPNEREPMIVKSLSIVGSILNITAQQRQTVRVKICPQVTQHRIWTGTLEEVLNGLKSELDCLDNQCPTKGTKIGQQIVCSCLKFLADTSISYDDDSASWMRLSTAKITESSGLQKWEDLLEMFNDLIDCLKNDSELLLYITKLEVMKEGLSQIKDVLVDKSIGYKEVRHQESLVQKKLSKTLGHSSKCLFTLLLYYLYGHVRDIEVDLCGGISSISKNSFCLCMGKIVTSDEETMIWSGVKQLDRALGLFKFVWETAGMEGVLQLQGHIWCVGAVSRTLTYRGNTFFVHGIHV
ncbi:hypothetical protein M0R45_011526 [Rubus argutus]|uniref:Uncharacterized protein n=1 Tax=Rubus argutus TaxID=59490 RepID=A0AAW1YAF6_RUBAR